MKVDYKMPDGSRKEILFGYVVDNHGWDKYIVAVDVKEKKKYTFNTYTGTIDDFRTHEAMESFAKYLGISIPENDFMPWVYTGRLNRLCHNDDFVEFYRKNFETVHFTESGLKY